MPIKKGGWAIGAACVILGFLLAAQFKGVMRGAVAEQSQAKRIESLQQMLGEEKERTRVQEGLLQQYKEEIDRYRSEALAVGGAAELLAHGRAEAELLAGLSEVSGPGLRITLADSAAETASGGSETVYLIHDSDLLMVINELRGAGAEALALNGQRLVATSEVRCAGAVVSVNNVRTAAPFVITAIGDPQTLYGALTMRGGAVSALERWQIGIDIEIEPSLILPRCENPPSFVYAQSNTP
jgi:uncharacterized protein YlxW (UPF0749 family)